VTVRQQRDVNTMFRFVIMPLYMFSGTFFAVSQLPHWLRDLAYVTPLWQGVELCRTLALGTATAGGTVVHVAYLAVLAIAGIVVARITYRRRLHA
jgi:ABC-type polysaccharide/polyol phosphate export permease